MMERFSFGTEKKQPPHWLYKKAALKPRSITDSDSFCSKQRRRGCSFKIQVWFLKIWCFLCDMGLRLKMLLEINWLKCCRVFVEFLLLTNMPFFLRYAPFWTHPKHVPMIMSIFVPFFTTFFYHFLMACCHTELSLAIEKNRCDGSAWGSDLLTWWLHWIPTESRSVSWTRSWLIWNADFVALEAG